MYCFRDKARYWSNVAIFSYPTCIRRPLRDRGVLHRNVAIIFRVEKKLIVGLSRVGKKLTLCLLILIQYTNVADMPWAESASWHRRRLYIASRGKSRVHTPPVRFIIQSSNWMSAMTCSHTFDRRTSIQRCVSLGVTDRSVNSRSSESANRTVRRSPVDRPTTPKSLRVVGDI